MKTFILLSVFAASIASAKDYSPDLYVTVTVDCTTHKLVSDQTGIARSAFLSVHGILPEPLSGQFDNEFNTDNNPNFSYTLNAKEEIVLTKKKSAWDLFGHDVTIVLGTPAIVAEQACDGAYAGSRYHSQWTPINFNSNVKAVETLEWDGRCRKHSLWPNEVGYSILKPYKQTVVFQDATNNESIKFSVETDLNLGHDNQVSLQQCSDLELP